ncbi:DUF6242 domain-containing protein [Prevotella sp. KH2C16]|uniref:DUF6242 domain-containing protein n=1 Tax=Prevotella sp. KH2C16 TaxID=1855325 RepID=UPI0008F0EA7F|nr:DUF6242 domain-containing protein [Prevotella sp. KH2C16]SFF86294.1 hypothetical protein SAMN05216383_101261 [Prevotella sp. KH2C16]
MRFKFIAFAVLFSAIFMFSSCLSDTKDDIVYYDDCALTAFSVGTLKIVKDTVSSKGEDSTYTTTLDCSRYAFTIDQTRGLIYNLDSLPRGINAAKVLVTAVAKNGGVVAIKSLTSDSLSYYSSSDSIDFSQPRHFVVYSLRGDSNRDYTVTLNVHKQKPEELVWNSAAIINGNLGSLKAMKGVACDGKVYVFGYDGSKTRIFAAPESNAAAWSEITPGTTLSADAYKSVAAYAGKLYVYSNGSLLASADAKAWTKVATPALKLLLGASNARLYGLTTAHQLMSSKDGGATWTADELDSDAGLLPADNLNFITLPLSGSTAGCRIVLAGTTATEARVWGKIEENDPNAQNQPWAYYNVSSGSKYKAPNLNGLQAVGYDGGILATGGRVIGAADSAPFACFYRSRDAGITWKPDADYHFPKGFSAPGEVFTMVKDSKNYLWIICGGTGQVWHGAKNRLVWDAAERYFTE